MTDNIEYSKEMISCGIDFGTSNSVCSLAQNGTITMVPVENGHDTIPSALFFARSGNILMGRAAIEAYRAREEGRLMRGLKSVLGTALMGERTLINTKSVAFEDILKIFLRHIKAQAEQAAQAPLTHVVMGRPVHFHDENPEADQRSEDTLRRVAQDIGFTDIIFQYEPVAAAYAHEKNLSREQIAIVADFGGGTSDFTIMRLSGPGPQQPRDQAALNNNILATGGIRVGGNNFDRRLSLKSFMPSLGLGSTLRDSFDADKILPMPQQVYFDLADWPRVNHAQTHKAILQSRKILPYADEPDKISDLITLQEEGLGHFFLQEVEQTKIALSDQDRIKSHFTEGHLDIAVTVKRPQFEAAIKQETQKINAALKDCLQQAGVKAQEIEMVILTGGSSQLPAIHHTLTALFPQAHFSQENRFASVGLGLGYMADALFA
ncbi:MAG TPA: Hsp70 family protein [Micavibrio sp.]